MTAEPTGPTPEPPYDLPNAPYALANPPQVIREIEHKFRVHSLFEIPDLGALDTVGGVDDAGIADVDSTYFDTADLRLIREGLALRRRRGGDDEGWHLKLPVDGEDSSVHDELRIPLSDTETPPAYLTWLVDPIVRDTPVGEVARLRGRRHRQMIRDTGDVAVALLVDDTMEVLDRDGQVTARFRELELDPIASTTLTGDVMYDVSTALSEAGALGGDFVAKVVRALGPQATTPPEVPVVTAPMATLATGNAAPETSSTETLVTVADAVAITLSRTIRRLRATDLTLRRNPDSPSAVHAAWIASLRLRTALRVFRPWLDDERSSRLYTAVKGAGDIIGRLHELDVVTQRLLDSLEALPHRSDDTGDRITAVLGARRRTARDDVLRMLESRDYRDLHDDLVHAAQEPLTLAQATEAPAVDALPSLVDEAWSRLMRRVEELSTDDHWYQALLAATRVRYAAEAVQPVMGEVATQFANTMTTVTDLLGEHHDAVVAEQFAAAVASEGETTAEVGFVLGTLAAGQRDLADATLAQFADVWAAASLRTLRQWFTEG